MTHLEKLHYDKILSDIFIDYDSSIEHTDAAIGCAQITQQIAIEFVHWYLDNKLAKMLAGETVPNMSDNELFNEFLQSLAPNPGGK